MASIIPMSTTHITHQIPDLLIELVKGKYKLPDFQRNYVWNKQQIMDLLDSLYKGIFIGVPSVVRYESGDFQSKNSRENNESPVRLRDLWARGELCKQLGLRPHKLSDISLVIDGQQRLTSILYIFYCETLALGSGRQTKEERHSVEKVKELIQNDVTKEDYEDKNKRKISKKDKNNFVIFIRHDNNLSDLEVSFESCEIKGNDHKNSEYDELKKKYLTTQELYDLYLDIGKKGKSIDSQEVKNWIKNKEQFSWIEKGNEQFRRWVKNNKDKLKDWIENNKESGDEEPEKWEKIKEWIKSEREYLEPDIDLGLIARRILEIYARKISDACSRLFSQYKIDMLEIRLSPSIPTTYALLNTLAITFDRINSKGIKIELFDIAVAAFYKKDVNIRKIFEDLQDYLNKKYEWGSFGIPFLDSGKGIRGEDILRIMALILRVTVKRAEILGGIHDKVQIAMGGRTVETIGKKTLDAKDPLSDLWEYAKDSYIKALERLREQYGVYSFDPSKQKSSMPYSSMLPVLAAFLHVAHHHPNADAHRDCVEAMIDFWYWISVFAERYSSSVDTTSETDVSQFRSWVENLGTKSARLPNFFWDDCGETISIDLAKTKQSQAVFRAVLNIIYMDDALDWSDDGVTIPKLKDLPPEVLNQDHIFPKDLLRYPKHSPLIKRIPPEVIENSILNRTLISKDANSKKGNKNPSDVLNYLDTLRSSYLPHLSLSKFLEGHLINPGAERAMAADDIAAFLEHRQKAIIERIQTLMVDILINRLAKCPHIPYVPKITFKAGSSLHMSLEEQE